ncbi:MAG: pyridoxal phosphate-dependent aminotransferase [Thermodesulfobacteriota bacterium]|mgnify:FL=1|jgi:aspartate/methionine/tyrosine aminotransferase|nr:aminotransferase class I/II-fold pyridoxal phosphate-dependent enzyme [bacterium]MBT3849846.1 aminotransferase class I/II-fold pyridoxal phosphate-dependent enzyme [bacterium]MDG2445640.1 aminotransferase class I/II-fold pyridoxal phosphate-dependent enzyme [Thermodesulfobacteriota bacterium]RZP13513.1 MAG: aminotransferase class I/II-fold pyridoxal phosphate-dependent enzyme [Candidatus Dadabacteria bacterium]
MKYNFSKRTDHFTLPKQWDSMRVAKKLEKETGNRIIHFEKGDYQGSDFETPQHILDATVRALESGYVRYDPGPGLPELREYIATETMKERRPGTKPEEVIITAGAKNALTMTLLSILEDGDEVVFPNPGYPPDEVWAKYANAKIHHTPLRKEDWQYDLPKLDEMITDKTKLLIINTPQRPNGQIVENPEAIAEIVLKHPNLLVITDEIFSQVIYDGQKHKTISSIPEMKDRCIVIDTWSKTYAMTGWRIGFAVANEEIITKLSIFLQDSITNVAAFIQRAAYEAVTGPQDWTIEKRDLLEKKRNLMVEGLNSLPGVTCMTPPGSFYCFPDITGTGMTSQEFTDKLVVDAGVAVVAGTAFGSQGEGFVRVTYAVHDDDIAEGIKRMKEFLS